MKPARSVWDRLWPRVVARDTGCWEWQGPLWLGYGKIGLPGGSRTAYVHRVVYAWLVGGIPEGMTLDHLCTVLEAAGSSMDRVLKVTVYLQDVLDYRAWNDIYERVFSPPYPARACIQAANMPFDVRVQVEAVAHL